MTTQSASTVERITYFRFSPRELARLGIYRAAVKASFFTDECEPLADFHDVCREHLLESIGEGC